MSEALAERHQHRLINVRPRGRGARAGGGPGSPVGLIGAKAYYKATHLEKKKWLTSGGMSIQGFVLAAVGTFLLGALLGGIPVRPLFDVTVPSLLLGQAVGAVRCHGPNVNNEPNNDPEKVDS